MNFRKLARIVNIDNISPIENAEKIELATVGGWNIAVKKEEFSVGDKAVYFEIDSLIPIETDFFSFLAHRPTKNINGKKYHKIKTIKLCGVISQGLLVPLAQLNIDENIDIDEDFSDFFGIIKIDEELDNSSSSISKTIDNFPSFIPKTEQKRIQNISKRINDLDGLYEVSMKIDGASISAFKKDGIVGIASRNTILEEGYEGNYKLGLINSGIWDFLLSYDGNIAIQGELVGPKICGNKEDYIDYQVLVYDIFDIDSQTYWLSNERLNFCRKQNFKHVPIVCFSLISDFCGIKNIISFADGESLNSKWREGLVFKSLEYRNDVVFSFKVISNKWLLTYS
jgi:RNA ligase (TIGR02306 family)